MQMAQPGYQLGPSWGTVTKIGNSLKEIAFDDVEPSTLNNVCSRFLLTFIFNLHLGLRPMGYLGISWDMMGYGKISKDIFGDSGYLF